ncbi:MAG TPA: CARDB domain-containing protein [Candidatus Bipolaricaulis anaerobius]|nr:CARDB domain-containing protein [Candidatus Bipolaricaulis anaerobius]
MTRERWNENVRRGRAPTLLSVALILAFGCAGLGQVEIVALDADRAAWDAVVAQARGAGLAATVKDYNEAALYNQVYLLVGIGMARFDVAQALMTWAPNVAARFADLTPYASQLQAAGLEIYRYGGRAIGVVLPWRAESFAGVSARSTRVKESVQLLTYLPAGGTRAPEATRVGVPLSIGPVTITKTEKRNPHVDGALETFVAATRQVVSTGVLTALTKVPAQARDALTKVAGMLGIPLSPAGDAVTLVIESKGGVAPLGVAVEPVSSPLGLTKVSVPLSQLESFLAQVGPGVYVRLPYIPHELAVTSQGASLVGASAFHSAGIRGSGVKVAVIDLGFSGLATSQAQGDLPYSVVTRDFTGTGIETGISHGTAVAQIVYDIAPDAQLYLVKIGNEVDLDNAVTYCISEGISIINHSLGWYNTNFYDGTGTIADIARRATSAGILWVQAAGNSGQKHYGATFTDGNSDGWHDSDVTFAATAGQQIAFYLTWDAWPATGDDYDLYLFGPTGTLVASSTATQGGTEQPTERITTTAGSSGTYRVRIQKASGATRRLSVFSIVHDLTPAVSASSMPAPANAAEVLSVGAINWTNYTSGPIAPYSSRGPTGDGRAKPDLAAPDNVTTGVSYYSPFPGTSAAAPHVAGVAALLKAEAPTLNRSSLASRILAFCVPMGDPYAFGAGRLEARPQTVAQADLIVDAITYSPTTPTLGSTITFQVTVRNQGTASAGSFVVRLQGVGPSQDQSVASLAAGASVTRTFTLPLSTSPETFTATADANGQVSESDEANNTRPVTITAAGPVARPDLVVDAITYSPTTPTLGQTVTFQVTVRNQGTASAGSFVLRLQEVASYQDATISSLAAGASTMRTFSLPLSTSPETFTATADANGQVSESDEANNTRPVTITAAGPVARPDLVVDAITYSPTTPTLGQTVTFQVTVRNQGTASAGSFVLRLQEVASYQDATISSLAAGASTMRTFSLPLSTSPETFTATADANGQVSESDEANNTRPVTITAAVPALGFTVATNKSTYAVGEPVRVTVTLSRASYVYLIELDAAGRAVFIFPNRWEPSPQLPAGTTQLPRTTAYSYTTAEPAGPEQIVGFASDRVIPYFPTSFGTGFPILATNGALFLSQVRSWLAANVPSGSWAEASAPFTIILPTNQPPTASFTYSPANPLPNQWITFDGRGSSNPDGTITSWAWNFGDGATGTGSQIQKRYSSGGTYTVALTVTDNRGATATTTRTVTVGTPNQPPTASFTFSPPNPDPGENVTFNASASSDPDGSIVTYSWSFGDGTTGTGMPITKAYTADGFYVVTLTVTDNLGATGTTTRTIQVGTPPPPPATLAGMPTIDRPGIYVWGDPEDHWHVTVAGNAGWTSPRPFEVTLETQGTFANRVFTPAGPSPAITASGGITKLVWTGTIGSGWADLAFDLTGATSMQLTLYLDTDGDGVARPANEADRPKAVFLRSCRINPPANPFFVKLDRAEVIEGATTLLPRANFRIGYCSTGTYPYCTAREWFITQLEASAGCR